MNCSPKNHQESNTNVEGTHDAQNPELDTPDSAVKFENECGIFTNLEDNVVNNALEKEIGHNGMVNSCPKYMESNANAVKCPLLLPSQQQQKECCDSNKNKLFLCPSPECPFKTDVPKSYSKHCKYHKIKKNLKCLYCSFSCDDQATLTWHLLSHIEAQNHPGSKSMKTRTANKGRLRKVRANLICYHCHTKFLYKRQMELHIMWHHLEKSTKFESTRTKKDLKNLKYQYLKKYLKCDGKTKKLNYHCPECPFRENSKKFIEFLRHFEQHKTTIGKKCLYCTYRGTSITIQRHEVLHVKRKPGLRCHFCPLRFIGRTAFLQHLKQKHKSNLNFNAKRGPIQGENTTESTDFIVNQENEKTQKNDTHLHKALENNICQTTYCSTKVEEIRSGKMSSSYHNNTITSSTTVNDVIITDKFESIENPQVNVIKENNGTSHDSEVEEERLVITDISNLVNHREQCDSFHNNGFERENTDSTILNIEVIGSKIIDRSTIIVHEEKSKDYENLAVKSDNVQKLTNYSVYNKNGWITKSCNNSKTSKKGSSSFKCPLCSYSNNRNILLKHLLNHVSMKESVFLCPFCPITKKNKEYVGDHIKVEHLRAIFQKDKVYAI
ncbi:hypothetical protein ABEB36_003138 [Hypothenemus hampei]|uniref:C2H2-type domain-containing protein n=1 Tax=Hypothenemus hampei TaxID=57062 RepID=A0ABD1F856_HYPHA